MLCKNMFLTLLGFLEQNCGRKLWNARFVSIFSSTLLVNIGGVKYLGVAQASCFKKCADFPKPINFGQCRNSKAFAIQDIFTKMQNLLQRKVSRKKCRFKWVYELMRGNLHHEHPQGSFMINWQGLLIYCIVSDTMSILFISADLSWNFPEIFSSCLEMEMLTWELTIHFNSIFNFLDLRALKFSEIYNLNPLWIQKRWISFWIKSETVLNEGLMS